MGINNISYPNTKIESDVEELKKSFEEFKSKTESELKKVNNEIKAKRG